jgi:hypothetical protein
MGDDPNASKMSSFKCSATCDIKPGSDKDFVPMKFDKAAKEN